MKMGKVKSLNICHVNVRSLNAESRLFDMDLLSANNNIDVLCISESWLNAKHLSATVGISGFDPPLRCDRSSGRGGGVALMCVKAYIILRFVVHFRLISNVLLSALPYAIALLHLLSLHLTGQ